MQENLLEKFNAKLYHDKTTLILTLFGDIAALADYPLIHLLKPEQYLLITKDLLNKANFQETLNTFSADIEAHWIQYTQEIVFALGQSISLPRTINDKLDLFKSYLLNFCDEAKANEYLEALKREIATTSSGSIDEAFFTRINVELFRPLQGHLKLTLSMPELANTLTAKLDDCLGKRKAKRTFKKRVKFIRNEFKRLCRDPLTAQIFDSALAHNDLKILVIANYQKFYEMTGRFSQSTGGMVRTKQDLIFIYWNNLYSKFPHYSILGGIVISDRDILRSVKQNGGEPSAMNVPFARVLTEEITDFWLNLQCHGDNPTCNQLSEHKALLDQLEKTVKWQKKIADKIINGKKLTRKESKYWKKMQRIGNKVYANATPMPTELYVRTPHYPHGTPTTLPNHGISTEVKFQGHVDSDHPFYMPPNEKGAVGVWKSYVKKGSLTAKEIASLYLALAEHFNGEYSIVKASYVPRGIDPLKEMLGKLLAHNTFFPGYLKTHFPKLLELYDNLAAQQVDVNAVHGMHEVVCHDTVENLCVRVCIPPSIPVVRVILPSPLSTYALNTAILSQQLTQPQPLPTITPPSYAHDAQQSGGATLRSGLDHQPCAYAKGPINTNVMTEFGQQPDSAVIARCQQSQAQLSLAETHNYSAKYGFINTTIIGSVVDMLQRFEQTKHYAEAVGDVLLLALTHYQQQASSITFTAFFTKYLSQYLGFSADAARKITTITAIVHGLAQTYPLNADEQMIYLAYLGTGFLGAALGTAVGSFAVEVQKAALDKVSSLYNHLWAGQNTERDETSTATPRSSTSQ